MAPMVAKKPIVRNFAAVDFLARRCPSFFGTSEPQYCDSVKHTKCSSEFPLYIVKYDG